MSDTASRPHHGLLFHASATTAALLALPWWHRALHIGADQYGGAWALIIVAALLYRRRPSWLRYAVLLASIVGAVTDLPVLHDSVSWTTGARW